MFASHAYSGNWHSTLYAYPADFGIPCLFFWLLFEIYALVYSYRACRIVTKGVFLPACAMYYALSLFVDAAFSYTTGHSSVTTSQNFLAYGMLLSIVRGYQLQQGFSAA